MGDLRKLPNGYTEVEYIENTDTAYIVTDYIPQQYDELYTKFMFNTDASKMQYLIACGYEQGIALASTRCVVDGAYRYCFYYKYFSENSMTANVYVEPYTWTELSINRIGHLVCNGYSSDSQYTNSTTNKLSIFGVDWDTNKSYTFIGKLSKLFIRRDGVYKLYLVPCIRESDNTAGLYDTVSEKFYSSANSNALLVAGGVIQKNDIFNNTRIRYLPEEYKQVEYLQTTGHDSKIDTGVSGADETLRIEMDYAILADGPDGSYYGPFGNAVDTSKKYWCMRRPATSSDASTTIFMVNLGNSNASKYIYPYGTGNTLRGKKIHVSMTYGQCVATGDRISTVTTDTISAAASTENIFIGTTSRVSSGIAACIGYIWYFKMWSGDVLIRDYVPCIRKSDNKAGFYDIINNTFNPSIGSTDFIAGGVVERNTITDLISIRRTMRSLNDLPPKYLRVAYIEDTDAKAYIDLQRKFNSTHRYKFEVQFLGDYHDLTVFGTRDQRTYYPETSSLTWVGDYTPIFYCGRHLAPGMTGFSRVSLQNTWQEFQKFEIKAYDGTFIITNSEGRHVITPGTNIEMGYEYETTTNIYFMNINAPGSIWGCKCRAKLYEEYDANDKLISRFIPCIRRSDNVAGMYDVVNNIFYNSANPSVPFTFA